MKKYIRKKPKFVRRRMMAHSRLGRRRKKLQKWARPTGRHNKMREKRKGVPVSVSIGYGSDKKVRGKIQGKQIVFVENLQQLEKVGANQIAIIGKIGDKKKLEIAKRAKEKRIEIQNLNIEKFLKVVEKKLKQKHEAKKIATEKQKSKEKEIAHEKKQEKIQENKKNFQEKNSLGFSTSQEKINSVENKVEGDKK